MRKTLQSPIKSLACISWFGENIASRRLCITFSKHRLQCWVNSLKFEVKIRY